MKHNDVADDVDEHDYDDSDADDDNDGNVDEQHYDNNVHNVIVVVSRWLQ